MTMQQRILGLCLLAMQVGSAQAADSPMPPSALERPRAMLSLDGTWQFATDPEGVGQRENWQLSATPLPKMPRPGYAPQANGAIQVPGCWDAQGYGVENDKVRHQFEGVGWYRREVDIPPEWAGRRVFLCVGGAKRQAKTWVNGQPLGHHVGWVSAFEYDITPHVKPGEPATIAIAVDSRRDEKVDPLVSEADILDYMGGNVADSGYDCKSQVAWGGLWSHVRLEARGDAYLADLFVEPRIDPAGCRVSADLGGNHNAADAVLVEIRDADGMPVLAKRFALANVLRDGRIVIAPEQLGAIPNARLWSIARPYLYKANTTLLKGTSEIDRLSTRFGLRVIETQGMHFLVNGRRTFLNGYGDDAIYPTTMSPPTDKQFYIDRLRLAKSYGFNYVRHHSHFLPEEYYDACDEVGMFVQPEAPLAYGNRATTPEARATYLREWEAAIGRHRNHPSIFVWCVGNEGSGEDLRKEFHEIAKTLDPSRLFIDSDGIQSGSWIDGYRDTVDFLTPQFRVFDSALDFPKQYVLPKDPAKPVVSHETGNYVTFPRFDQIQFFKDNMKPFWLEWGRAKYEKLGLLADTDRWARNSEQLYLELHKLNVEAIRKSGRVAGYHFWLFQDFWTTHNGLVELYFRPKSITPQEVLRFNNDIVLLEDGLELTYRGGQTLKTQLSVSNFSERSLDGAMLTWRLKLGGQIVRQVDARIEPIGQGEIKPLGAVEFALPAIERPCEAAVEAELSADGRRVFNDWTVRVFPAEAPAAKPVIPLFADAPYLEMFAVRGALPIPAELPSAPAVYVTSKPSEAVLAAVEKGAVLVVLDPKELWETRASRYKLPWWRPIAFSGSTDCNQGTVADDHPITRGMAPDGWCDKGWYHLLEGAEGVFLDKFTSRPKVVVLGVESVLNGRDKAFVFEARVGQGTVVVSGLNYRQAAGRPECQWLLSRIIDYAASLPKPSVEISVSDLKKK